MYKIKIISSLFFLNTSSYSKRSFFRSRLEGLEYQILFSFVKESKKILKYKTSKEEQRKLILSFGKAAILIDDMQDENMEFSSKEFIKSLEIIKNSLLNNSHREKFYYNLNVIMKNQRGNTMKEFKRKGGAFALCLIYLLNPLTFDAKIAKAFYYGGAWGQIIDNYADGECDEDTLKKFSSEYRTEIKKLIGNEKVIIPFAEDLISLSKFSRLPLLKNIFNFLNKS